MLVVLNAIFMLVPLSRFVIILVAGPYYVKVTHYWFFRGWFLFMLFGEQYCS